MQDMRLPGEKTPELPLGTVGWGGHGIFGEIPAKVSD